MTSLRYCLPALFCATAALAANGLTNWGESGQWSVLVDPDSGNGCLIQKDFSDGLRIRFGNLPLLSGGFFAALSRDWSDLEAGTTGTVRFLTGEAKFAGEAEFLEEDGWYGGSAFFNNPNFVTEMAKRRSITVIGPSGGTFEVDLAGSSKAIDLMQECQEAQK
ncbi:hypothetical protein R5H32_19020 [Defluviimonas sp. D31]|uniref:hypothetical protein n=1 Tax=Defluviimonas sp. D31 TaxID=3083253 RepID=UPI00296F65A1|nr:hypothetical protein [Defluviimonas sp. D31]MDW4551445.1 hypothetical protein [Defluviimonas sp. D31]